MVSTLILLSSLLWAQEVTIIKQWHPSPGTKTENIFTSKNLPQFKNQKEIYRRLSELAQKSQVTVISEGCAGDVKKTNHYGWTEEKLKSLVANSDYPDVVAFIPLKLSVKFPDKVASICADDEDLMKKNQIAFSNVRGYLGFYARLKQFKDKDQKSFETYSKALFEKEPNKKGKVDAVSFARQKASESLAAASEIIEKRNGKILNAIKENLKASPYVIVGGLHAKGLVSMLDSSHIKYTIIVPDGYQEADEKLLDQLKSELNEK